MGLDEFEIHPAPVPSRARARGCDDLPVRRVIDLDQAGAVIAERAAWWRAAGLTVGRVTWRDEAAPWPQQLETDRTLVRDPDSIGVVVSGPADAELSVVLFRGGWADVDYCHDGLDDVGVLPAVGIDSAAAFASRLDQWVSRVFGPTARRGPAPDFR
ncbi:hypothetical protein ACQB60_09775 [Actinomycetota bacterium Odt1-20B]